MRDKTLALIIQELIDILDEYLDQLEMLEPAQGKAALTDARYFAKYPDEQWYFRNIIPGEFGYVNVDDRVFVLRIGNRIRRFLVSMDEEAEMQISGQINQIVQYLTEELQ